MLGLEIDPPADEPAAPARLPVVDGVCQPMGIVHGGVYAAIAETLASMGTGARRASRNGGSAARPVQQHELSPAVQRGHDPRAATAFHRGRTSWVWDVEMRDDEGRLCATSRVTIAVRVEPRNEPSARSTTRSRSGSSRSPRSPTRPSITRTTSGTCSTTCPSSIPLPGIAYGQRWVSTPVCRAARTVSTPTARPDPLRDAATS